MGKVVSPPSYEYFKGWIGYEITYIFILSFSRRMNKKLVELLNLHTEGTVRAVGKKGWNNFHVCFLETGVLFHNISTHLLKQCRGWLGKQLHCIFSKCFSSYIFQFAPIQHKSKCLTSSRFLLLKKTGQHTRQHELEIPPHPTASSNGGRFRPTYHILINSTL